MLPNQKQKAGQGPATLSVALLLVGTLFWGCQASDEEKELIQQAFGGSGSDDSGTSNDDGTTGSSDTGSGSGNTGGGNTGGNSGGTSGSAQACFIEEHTQAPAELTKTIDILFVTDTSGSLYEERAGIAAGIDAFVTELPADVDYRIGVMLAHGDQTSWSGKLYQRGHEPVVLDSSTMDLATIREHLQVKLTQVRRDSETDGGEVGLYSMHRALRADRLAESRQAGFFRPGAALAVVYIADENDICSGQPEGVTLLPDPDGKEVPAAEKYCANVNAQSVLEELKTLQGERPLLVSGIVYNDPATVPVSGENEVGYGYLEQIELANGISIDLARGSYDVGLSQIGRLATIKLSLKTEFGLANSPVDEPTVGVTVDQVSVNHLFVEELNEVHLDKQDAGGALSKVSISYCTKDEPEPEPSGSPPPCSGVSCGGGIGV